MEVLFGDFRFYTKVFKVFVFEVFVIIARLVAL
jgi:hypothetical protein